MINQPESNVVLTDDQLKQIEQASLILANLQNETNIATNLNLSLKKDNVRIAKEKEYQDGLLQTITDQVREQQAKLNLLNEEYLRITDSLSVLSEDYTEKIKVLDEKELSVRQWQDDISVREQNVKNLESALAKSVNNHTNEKEDFNQKVIKLKELIAQYFG